MIDPKRKFIDLLSSSLPPLVTVDAKYKMIVEAVANQVVDMGLLTQTAEPARAILVSRPSMSSRRSRLLQPGLLES